MVTDNDGKYLEVKRLIELLNTIDPHYRIRPNSVGNLMVTDASDIYQGFIDFVLEGSVELYVD